MIKIVLLYDVAIKKLKLTFTFFLRCHSFDWSEDDFLKYMSRNSEYVHTDTVKEERQTTASSRKNIDIHLERLSLTGNCHQKL